MQQAGDIGRARLARQLSSQFAVGPQTAADIAGDMNRQANHAGLIDQGAFDVLAYPPGRVSGKSKAALRVEFLDGPHQAEIAFLDQVQQGQAAMLVMPRQRHHQPEVALDQRGSCRGIALSRQPAVVLLLVGIQQSRLAEFPEILPGRVELRFPIVGGCPGRASLGLEVRSGCRRFARVEIRILERLHPVRVAGMARMHAVGLGRRRRISDSFPEPGCSWPAPAAWGRERGRG